MGFLKELYLLTRFEHALMLALAVLIGEIILIGGIPIFTLPIILSLLVPMLSEVGSFSLNDYLDIESDRINKKNDRPLVKGTISPGFALWLAVFSLLLSTALSYFINIYAFAIVLIFNLAAILYNWKLKDLPLVGNVYIGFTMGIPFIFGNFVITNELSTLAILLAALGFVSGLAREIVKSAQDIEGDLAARSSKTLPIMIGRKKSLWIASLLYSLFLILTILPFQHGLKLSIISAPLILIADLIILFVVFSLHKSDQSLKKSRNLSLVALFIGLIGLLAAAI
jgi:geranylgeranylglycerol-phosphate geranylgeranyltransferase